MNDFLDKVLIFYIINVWLSFKMFGCLGDVRNWCVYIYVLW